MAKYVNSDIGILTFDSTAGQKWATYDIDTGVEKIVNSKDGTLAYYSSAYTLAQYDSTTAVASNPTTTVNLEVTKSNGRSITAGAELSLKQQVAAGVGVANATASVELGLQYEHEWTSNIDDGISFEGTVGNVPISWAAQNKGRIYRQGMFLYPVQFLVKMANDKYKQEIYWVVDYFVEH